MSPDQFENEREYHPRQYCSNVIRKCEELNCRTLFMALQGVNAAPRAADGRREINEVHLLAIWAALTRDNGAGVPDLD